jgi:benzoylformate decarboxylase
VQLHSNPGLGNGIGMMYQAFRGHAPLVVIAAEAGIRYDATDAQMAGDMVALARPVTKWATRVVDPTSLLRVLRRAMKVAATPPCGPVFVCLPMDVLDAPTSEDVVPTSFPSTRVAPSQEDVDAAAAMLAGASNPMIIMGDGIAFSGAEAELTRVAEVWGAQVWGADSSENNIDSTHPCFAGLTGHMFGEHSLAITSQADAVLISGTYVLPEVFPMLSDIFAPGCKVVHVDLDAWEIAKNHPVDLGFVADPKLTLASLASSLDRTMSEDQKTSASERVSAMRDRKAADATKALEADEPHRDSVPLHASVFFRALGERLDENAVIFDEALTTSPELTQYIPPRKPGTYFQTRGGSLGVGIPGAIGLKLAKPEATVIGVTGDGGSMYTIQALWTAAHHNVGAKFIVCNNRSYQLLKLNIMQYWKERQIPEHEFPASFDITNPDLRFDDIARSLGVEAARVEKPDDVGPAIDKMLAHDGPFLIDLVLSNEVPGHKLGQRQVHQQS